VRAIAPPGARILDWGIANGHFSYFLVRAGYRTYGYSLEDLTFARLLDDPAYGFVRGGPARPIALPFRDASFDVVASVGVLEHVRETGGDELASLREIARILRPGGCFLCYHFPNRTSWVEFLARQIPGKPHHSSLYARTEILALVGGAGMRLESLRRYAILPRNTWGAMPAAFRNSRLVASGWDALDGFLERLLPPLCTYFSFVARKPS